MESSSSKVRYNRQQLYKQTLQRYLSIGVIKQSPSIALQSKYDCPLFTKNIQEILVCYLLKKEVYQQTIEQVIQCIKKIIERINFNLNETEAQNYRAIIEDNQKLIKTKTKKIQLQFQWTIFKMLKIDILSSFLKINHQYRMIHNIKGSVLRNKFLCKIFDIQSDVECKLYSSQLRNSFQFIQFPYQQDFKQLILLSSLVELKLRTSTFRKKFGRYVAEKIQSQIKSDVLKQAQRMFNRLISTLIISVLFLPTYFFIYKKCEELQNKSDLDKVQVKVLVQNLMSIQNIPQRKRQISKIKLTYSISFQSLFRYVENQKKLQDKDEINQYSIKNLQKTQWAFFKDNNYGAINTIQKILKVQLPNCTNLLNDKSILMKTLCGITMKRIALLININKVHHKIDTYLNRQTIYIYKLQFCHSQFSKKVQQNDKYDEEQDIYTLVLATTDKEIVYAAMFQYKLNEYQFARVIKIAAQQFKSNNFNIFLYIFFDSKPFDWTYIDGLFVIRHYYDVRFYLSASTQPFIIHFCAYHLISMLIKKAKPNRSNFMNIAESSALTVINAFANSPNARLICSQINKHKQKTIDQSYQQQFDQQKMEAQVRTIFKSLYYEISKQKDLKNKEKAQIKAFELFKNRKLFLSIIKPNKNMNSTKN